MVGNLQVQLNGKFIVTPKLLLYSQTSPNCKTPLLCSNKICFLHTLVHWQQLMNKPLILLHTLLNPKIQQQMFTGAQHNHLENQSCKHKTLVMRLWVMLFSYYLKWAAQLSFRICLFLYSANFRGAQSPIIIITNCNCLCLFSSHKTSCCCQI